jgi:hypothetical protein
MFFFNSFPVWEVNPGHFSLFTIIFPHFTSDLQQLSKSKPLPI